MIEIYNYKNELIASGDTSVSGIVESPRRTIIVYIDYRGGGTETSTLISFNVREKSIGDKFPIQIDNGDDISNYERTLTPGNKYRIILPIAESEDKVEINLSMQGDLTTPGILKVWVIPDYYTY